MIRSLPDRIHDCHQMKNLYPNMPKDTAFGKYYSSPPETVPRGSRNGYVPHHLVNVIPGPQRGLDRLDSFPGTPATSYYNDPQSPPSARNTPMSSVHMMESQSNEEKFSLGLEQEKSSHMIQELDQLQMDEFNDFCGEFNN